MSDVWLGMLAIGCLAAATLLGAAAGLTHGDNPAVRWQAIGLGLCGAAFALTCAL